MYSKIRFLSILSVSALTLGTCIPAGLAFADDDPLNVGDQSGAGSTALTMIWEDPDTEYMGTEEPETNNPDTNPHDGLGDNLAFKAPTAINFVAKASGDLIAPSAGSIYIQNYSAFGIKVSSMKITENEADGWNIVSNAEAANNVSNAVWGSIGPYNEMLNWAGWVGSEKTAVTTPSRWGMSAAGAENNYDKLYMIAEGKFANLSIDLSQVKTFGTIHWYLQAGGEGQRFVDPATIHSLNKPTSTTNGSFELKSSISASDVLTDGIENDTVYIVATPNQDYKVDNMSVITTEGSEDVSVTRNVNDNPNIGSFTMPDEDVNISVTFKNAIPDVPASQNALAALNADDLKELGDAVRDGNISVNAFNDLLGTEINVTLHNGSTVKKAIFVDVSTTRGLTFMFKDAITKAAVNTSGSNVGGWPGSEIRSSMNSGAIYNSYLSGMTIGSVEVEPYPVILSSLGWVDDSPAVITNNSDDKDAYWLPSVVEIYGTDIWRYYKENYTHGTYDGDENCSQFLYYEKEGVHNLTNFSKLSNTDWRWQRSVDPAYGASYNQVMNKDGSPGAGVTSNTEGGVAPCFCL